MIILKEIKLQHPNRGDYGIPKDTFGTPINEPIHVILSIILGKNLIYASTIAGNKIPLYDTSKCTKRGDKAEYVGYIEYEVIK